MRKKFAFYLLLFFIVAVLLESFSYAGLHILKQHKGVNTYYDIPFLVTTQYRELIKELSQATPESLKDQYSVYEPDLGWTLNPSAEYGKTRGISLGTTNAIATRNTREYTPTTPPGKIRIATFGDSFTHGASIPNNLTWQEMLEQYDERLEVLNYGVSGYGLDQANLRYLKDGVKHKPDIVLICFMSEMMARNVNVFTPYYWRTTKSVWIKPRFVLKNDQLILKPTPVQSYPEFEKLLDPKFLKEIAKADFWSGYHKKKSVWERSAFYHLVKLPFTTIGPKGDHMAEDEIRSEIFIPTDGRLKYNTDSEAYKITLKIFDKFYADVEANGSIPVIVFLPARNYITDFVETNQRVYQSMLDYLRDEKGYRVLDAMDILGPLVRKYGLKEVTQSHYKPSGNRGVCYLLHQYLKQNKLI